MRVVLDTNVLVRAAGRSDSPARAVFERLLQPPHDLIASPFLLDELRRVMQYPRVQQMQGLSPEQIEQHVQDVAKGAELVDLPSPLTPAVLHDPDDDPIVATAVYGQTNVLCTLDRHLRSPSVEAYCAQFRIRILTDVELLNELRQLDQPSS